MGTSIPTHDLPACHPVTPAEGTPARPGRQSRSQSPCRAAQGTGARHAGLPEPKVKRSEGSAPSHLPSDCGEDRYSYLAIRQGFMSNPLADPGKKDFRQQERGDRPGNPTKDLHDSTSRRSVEGGGRCAGEGGGREAG